MAASLLGPLISSEIKEAEEKWRKRLLTGLDEPGSSVDSDGEGGLPAGSPAPPPLDADLAQNVQSDVSIKKQPGETTEAEEETEEDTVELELALERKKVCVGVKGGGFKVDSLDLLFIMPQQCLNVTVGLTKLLSGCPMSQAELRALEEGDGSAGGSSPCSETSQEASGSRGILLKKNRWKTAFPCAASPDSNSRSSDAQDNTETGESTM